ncbi:MAG: sensor histidine kinase [Bacteroidota bacterium]
MKRIINIFWVIALFSCNNRKDVNNPIVLKEVDSLFSVSNDFNVNKQQRVLLANKLFELLQNRDNDSIKRAGFYKLAGRYFNAEEYKKYLAISKELYVLSVEANDTISMAKSLGYIGDFYYSKFKNDSAYFYYSKAEKIYSKKKDIKDALWLKLYKANILFYEKDFSGCETSVIDILKLAKNHNNTRLVYDCYITLGNALEGLNDDEQALEYYKKAFALIETLSNDKQYQLLKAQTYNYIGKIYQKEEDYQKAIDYFNKALRFETSKSLLYANLKNNLGYSNFKLGNESAIKYLKEAMQIRDSLQNIPGLVSSNLNMSKYYLAKGDNTTALKFALKAREKAASNKIFEDELSALELLSKIEPQKSLYYTNKYISLNDSLHNIERATRNKFARIEFETDEIVNEKNSIAAEKDKLSSQRWFILICSIIAIIIVVLVYITRMQHAKNKELQFERKQQEANEEIYRLMLKQQSVINEARQGEKKRISQELHDGVMSKLTSTRLNLFILSKKNDEETIKKCLEHIDEIQDIEKEIRNISHDLNRDTLLEKDSFQAIVNDLFSEYKNIIGLDYFIKMDEKIIWKKIESATKIHLYRIFQEALQNIYKYANATDVDLEISKEDDLLLISIKDNGQGFDVAKIREGIGLKNMQSRIKILEGTFNIESVLGLGTSIKITIPI